MQRLVLLIIVLAACGKGGGGAAGSSAESPAIPTKSRSIPVSAGSHVVTGTLPDWKQGENALGHGERELYVEGTTGTLALIRVELWNQFSGDGDVLAGMKEQAQYALAGRVEPSLTNNRTLLPADKPFVVQDATELSPGVFAFAIGWRDSTQNDAQVGVYAKVAVAKPDTSDAAHPLRGFTCAISAFHTFPKDPSYLESWRELAKLCGGLALEKVKK